MKFSNLFNQLTEFADAGKGFNKTATYQNSKGIADKIPGGLAGGAIAGGLMAVLMSNKKVRKSATTAAKYGGAAALGGLAYNAYRHWKQDHGNSSAYTNDFEQEALTHRAGNAGSSIFQAALVKAMISAARADGAIDVDEQQRISEAINAMHIDDTAKVELFELFSRPISIYDFVDDLQTTEQKAEAYLVSCLVIDLDDDAEYAHLNELSKALQLPNGLEIQLRRQATGSLNAIQ